MTKQKIDVEGILNTLAAVRRQVPYLADTPTRDTAGDAALLASDDEALELFEMVTLAGALESFAGELSDSIETAQQQAMTGALEIYYAAEKLAKDPEHAHLIPYVEQMRRLPSRLRDGDSGEVIPIQVMTAFPQSKYLPGILCAEFLRGAGQRSH
jgi:hypothetical protein